MTLALMHGAQRATRLMARRGLTREQSAFDPLA
jgi:hypothetical protein